MLNLNNNYATRSIPAATVGSASGGPITMVVTFETGESIPDGGVFNIGAGSQNQYTGFRIVSGQLQAGMRTVAGTPVNVATMSPNTLYTAVLTRDNAGNSSITLNGGSPVTQTVSPGAITYTYYGVGTFWNGSFISTSQIKIAHVALYRRALTNDEIAAYHAKNLDGIATTNRFDYHSLISDLDSDAGGTALTFVDAESDPVALDGYDPFAPLYSLNSINDGSPVIPGQPFTWVATGFTPTSGTIGGIALSGVSSSGATAPGYVDGGPILLPGTRTVTAIDGSTTASSNATVGVIPGYTYTVLEPGFDEGNYSVVQGAGASAGWFVIHPEGDDVGPNALLKTNVEGTRTYWLGDPVSGLGYSYLVTTGSDGSVTVSRSLTSVGITGSGITGRGITGVGI